MSVRTPLCTFTDLQNPQRSPGDVMRAPLIRFLPNALTISRILMAPYLVLSSLGGTVGAYVPLVLLLAFSTDFLDGWLARKFELSTPLGAWLDSMADSIFYWGIAACLWMTQSAVPFIRESIICLIGVQIINWTFALIKFRQLTSYHTTIAKWTAPAIYFGVTALFWIRFQPLYWLAVVLGVVSNLEDMVITAILPSPKTNVPNIAAARALRRKSAPDSTA